MGEVTIKALDNTNFEIEKGELVVIVGPSGAGAASILFAGFSVQYSISDINKRQFEDIIKYDAIVALNDKLTDEEEKELNNLLNNKSVDSYIMIKKRQCIFIEKQLFYQQ